MKLIIAIVHDQDAGKIIDEFSDNNLKITKMSSTGGFMQAGNTTLLSGVEDDEVGRAVKIIEDNSESRQEIVKNKSHKKHFIKQKENEESKVSVGRATIFVTDIERFIKF